MLPELTVKVENAFLQQLILCLKAGILDESTAKDRTNAFLTLQPFRDLSDINTKLKAFTNQHPEFSSVYIALLSQEEHKKTTDLLGKIRGLMKENKIDEVINLVK